MILRSIVARRVRTTSPDPSICARKGLVAAALYRFVSAREARPKTGTKPGIEPRSRRSRRVVHLTRRDTPRERYTPLFSCQSRCNAATSGVATTEAPHLRQYVVLYR
jgi:hypothetical protein